MKCVLICKPNNQIVFLNQEQFRILLLCDGRTDLDVELLAKKEQDTIGLLMRKKLVIASECAAPIHMDQEYRFFSNRYIAAVQWSVTGRCNFRCRHCMVNAPDFESGDLSHEEALEIIDQLAQCGIMRVDITGGEPFVRPDFWPLVDALSTRNITIGQIYTNGWLVNEFLLAEFAKRNIKPEFCFSFDGVGWHDWMRGILGAEDAVLKAIGLCIKEGFKVSVEMCVHRGNLYTLRDTVNLLSGMGVPRLSCSGVADTPLWQQHSGGNALSAQEYCEAMIAYIPHFFEDDSPINLNLSGIISLRTHSKSFEVLPDLYGDKGRSTDCHLCDDAQSHCYIAPDGRLIPCMPLSGCKEREMFPKIPDVGLRAALSDDVFMKFVDRRVSDLIQSNTECAHCPYVLRCGGGCRASALMYTGNLMGVDKNLCMMWREGWVDRIRQAAEDAIRRFPPKETENEPTAG